MRHSRLLIVTLVLILAMVPLIGCEPASEYEDIEVKYELLLLRHDMLKAELESVNLDLAYVKDASQTLRDEYGALETKYNTLKADYDMLREEYEAPITDYTTLKAAFQKLQSDYDAAQVTHHTIQSDYDALQADYQALEALYNDVSNELAEIKRSPSPVSTPTPILTPDTESVSVYKIVDYDRALITRKNNEAWILEKGIGCLSLDFYEGQHILIYSPGLFAGVGSKIILPDRDQICIIWDAEFLGMEPTFVESHINGVFEGWDGDTIFELRNGQIWQQASYSYTYHYAFSPEVFIYSANGGYKMIVDGVSETIYVRRLE